MAGETVITVIGNLTSDPELRFTPSGSGSSELHHCFHPADLRPPVQRVEGRGNAVPPRVGVARSCRERRRDPDQGHARDRSGPAEVAVPTKPKKAKSAPSSSSRSMKSAPRCATPPPRSPAPSAPAVGAAAASAAARRRWLSAAATQRRPEPVAVGAATAGGQQSPGTPGMILGRTGRRQLRRLGQRPGFRRTSLLNNIITTIPRKISTGSTR